jgi:hypothetical protein
MIGLTASQWPVLAREEREFPRRAGGGVLRRDKKYSIFL